MDDAAVDQALVVVGLDFQNASEVGQGDAGLPLVEVGFAQKVVELVVLAIQSVSRLESLQCGLDVEAVQGVLRIFEELVEEGPTIALV